MLELWQRSAANLAGAQFDLQTSSVQTELQSASSPSNSALQAMLKVMAAEGPGTKFSGLELDSLVLKGPRAGSEVCFLSYHSAVPSLYSCIRH